MEHIPLSSEYMIYEGINLFEQVSFLVYCSWDGMSVVIRLESGWSRVQIMAGSRSLFILPKTGQTGLGAHTASYSMSAKYFFPSL